MLLVHGNMRTSRSFDAVSRVLNGDSHVLAMDLIGHGNSTWTPSGYKFSDRSKDEDNFVTENEDQIIAAILPAILLALGKFVDLGFGSEEKYLREKCR